MKDNFRKPKKSKEEERKSKANQRKPKKIKGNDRRKSIKTIKFNKNQSTLIQNQR